MERNNTDFINTVIKKLNEPFNSDKHHLRPHQVAVVRYFLEFNIRGLLVFHKMGMGKTHIAAAIAKELIKTHVVIFISAKTLHQNFNVAGVKYVSLNASNMIDQVNRANMSELDELLGKKAKLRNALDKTLIIMDEAHNFFNSVTNGSKNATELYAAILKSDCRVLLLTGSPIMNDPFELSICFNMLAGWTLLPERYREFNGYFIKDGKIANGDKFANRISGLLSYYDDQGSAKMNVQMPEKREPIIVECKMSSYQYKLYYEARKLEMKKKVKKFVAKEYTLQKIKPSNASYRVMSRQRCNFAYPEYAIEKKRTDEGKLVDIFLPDMLEPEDVLKNLDIYSMKIKMVVEAAMKLEGINMIYSQFLQSGLNIFKLVFEAMKFTKYVCITGEESKEEIYKYLEIINSEENKLGQIYKIILVSSAGSEGVNFRHIMQIHCLELYWHWSRMEQIFGRGVRANSHVDMPKNMQYVQPFIYISVHGIKENTELTSDQHLLEKSKRNSELINSFYAHMKMVAFDCKLFYKNCKNCAGNIKLFDENLDLDMKIVDPCKTVKTQNARIFHYNGKTYAEYIQDGETYFAELNPETGKYVPVNERMRRILMNL